MKNIPDGNMHSLYSACFNVTIPPPHLTYTLTKSTLSRKVVYVRYSVLIWVIAQKH